MVTVSAIIKYLLVISGSICVVLGVVGIFVPLLPTTPFLLLAAACYVKSSDKAYLWLINHRWFGQYVKNYREGKGITRKTKIATIIILWATIGYSALIAFSDIKIKLMLLVIACGVTYHVVSLKESK